MAEKSAKKVFQKNFQKTIYKIVIVWYNIIIRNKEYKFLGGKSKWRELKDLELSWK